MKTLNPGIIGDNDNHLKFEEMFVSIMMIMIGFFVIIIYMAFEGKIKSIKCLTKAERFVYFQMLLVATSVAIPNHGLFIENKGRLILQAAYGSIITW